MFSDVREFHERFNLPTDRTRSPTAIRGEELEFRVKFLREELEEFIAAAAAGSVVGMADALADLTYVALGTAHYMGLPFDEVWREVHASNMRKVRASSASESKRGTSLDVVKPAGWRPPDIASVLERFK